jgi:hypothetical protein
MPEIYKGVEDETKSEWQAPEKGENSSETPAVDFENSIENRSFTPTFPSSELSIDDFSDGMRWGECRVPISFDFSASLSSDRGGQAAYDGTKVEISISSGIPPEFQHIVLYHELIEAEALSNGLPGEESHPMACEMEAQYISAYLSQSEKEAYESLMGVPNSPEKKSTAGMN